MTAYQHNSVISLLLVRVMTNTTMFYVIIVAVKCLCKVMTSKIIIVKKMTSNDNTIQFNWIYRDTI